jgi:hypothetical protein
MIKCLSFRIFPLLVIINLIACAAQLGETVIPKPDEYRYRYEAREKFVLKAIVQVFNEKNLGKEARIDQAKQTVETDYIVQDDWRTKSIARVKQLDWKECEVILSVITEKKTKTGWEQRRLLEEEQYLKIFNEVELKIYQEMYKTE